MPRVSPLQSNFNGGEFSPLVYGRVDSDRYKTGLAKCLNYIPTIQGGLTKRPGTMFVSEVKDSTKATRLLPFIFSITQAYMLEFGNQYIRFYKNNELITLAATNITGITQANPGVVTSNAHGYSNGDRVIIQDVGGMTPLNNREFIIAGAAANTYTLKTVLGADVDTTGYPAYTSGGTATKVYEIASTYLEADLFQLKTTQSADVLYIVHPSYPPAKLTRTGHTSWTLTAITFLDGPYLIQNSTTTTLTPSAATGAGVTLTASSIVGINGGAGFATTDVGRFIRLKEGSVWGYVLITAFTSTTVVIVTVINTLTDTSAKSVWRLGVWSATTGYPGAVVFHEDRLCFAGATNFPERMDGSNTSDYENFAPSGTDGTIVASNAISFTFNSNQVNVVRWMTSDEKGLLIGSVGGEWVMKPSILGEAISPTNVNAKQVSSYGSANIQPVQSGNATIYVQGAKRKVREMTYFYTTDGFQANDMTLLAEHISNEGVVEIARQKEPQSVIWFVRSDGALLGMTYERDQDSLKVGWHRHQIGGVSDAAGSSAKAESVAVIPSSDATRDDVWLLVHRWINGRVVRCVEYITKIFEDIDLQQDAFFVDAGLTYDVPVSISAITLANPGVITANSHGFSNGDTVRVDGVVGMVSPTTGLSQINGEYYLVANKSPNTFELKTVAGVNVNTSSFAAYVSGGQVRKLITTITGLGHLEGQVIQVCADGAVQPDVTVTLGKITLTTPAAVVHLGYSYNSDGQQLRLEAGSADGTSIGKIRRISSVAFLVHRSLGLSIGTSFDNLTRLTFRTSSDPLTRAPPLFSGIIQDTVDADYDTENQICWRQNQPLPSMILAVMPQQMTYDKG